VRHGTPGGVHGLPERCCIIARSWFRFAAAGNRQRNRTPTMNVVRRRGPCKLRRLAARQGKRRCLRWRRSLRRRSGGRGGFDAAVVVVGLSALFVGQLLSAGGPTPVRCLNRIWCHPTISGTRWAQAPSPSRQRRSAKGRFGGVVLRVVQDALVGKRAVAGNAHAPSPRREAADTQAGHVLSAGSDGDDSRRAGPIREGPPVGTRAGPSWNRRSPRGAPCSSSIPGNNSSQAGRVRMSADTTFAGVEFLSPVKRRSSLSYE
jgi:hypothetical protein